MPYHNVNISEQPPPPYVIPIERGPKPNPVTRSKFNQIKTSKKKKARFWSIFAIIIFLILAATKAYIRIYRQSHPPEITLPPFDPPHIPTMPPFTWPPHSP